MSPSRLIVLCILVLIFCLEISAQRKYSENDYADHIQSIIGGQREFSVTNGRVDLLTDTIAYEIEWASKWKESIGQSLWYALNTSKRPGVILIMEDTRDYKYYQQLNSALQFSNMQDLIIVRVYPNDFVGQSKK